MLVRHILFQVEANTTRAQAHHLLRPRAFPQSIRMLADVRQTQKQVGSYLLCFLSHFSDERDVRTLPDILCNGQVRNHTRKSRSRSVQ